MCCISCGEGEPSCLVCFSFLDAAHPFFSCNVPLSQASVLVFLCCCCFAACARRGVLPACVSPSSRPMSSAPLPTASSLAAQWCRGLACPVFLVSIPTICTRCCPNWWTRIQVPLLVLHHRFALCACLERHCVVGCACIVVHTVCASLLASGTAFLVLGVVCGVWSPAMPRFPLCVYGSVDDVVAVISVFNTRVPCVPSLQPLEWPWTQPWLLSLSC
jgi:hypothetical protein